MNRYIRVMLTITIFIYSKLINRIFHTWENNQFNLKIKKLLYCPFDRHATSVGNYLFFFQEPLCWGGWGCILSTFQKEWKAKGRGEIQTPEWKQFSNYIHSQIVKMYTPLKQKIKNMTSYGTTLFGANFDQKIKFHVG